MRKPALNSLKVDKSETRRIRSAKGKPESVKITINIDADSLAQLRKLSEQTDIPYQRLLNKYLREALAGSDSVESRLQQLEKELARLKKKIAA